MRERRPGYWELRVSLGRDPQTGKPRYRTKGLRATKREAQRALAALVTEVDSGKGAPSTETVAGLLDSWLRHISLEGRSPTTLDSYAGLRRQLPEDFLRLPVAAVNTRIVDDLYRQLSSKDGRGPSTVHHFHRLLRAAFNQAMRWEIVDRNPIRLATPPQVPHHEIEPPAVGDVRKILDLAATNETDLLYGRMFRILAATGCRRGEVCGLRWSDVSLDRSEITVRRSVVQVGRELIEKDTKGHQQRTVTLDPATLAMLRSHRREHEVLAAEMEVQLRSDGYVFSKLPDCSRPISPDRLSKVWRSFANVAGVSARLHDLRHLQASLLLEAGESITTVAARLGHRDAATTLRVYSHLMPGADQRAAEIIGQVFDTDSPATSDLAES